VAELRAVFETIDVNQGGSVRLHLNPLPAPPSRLAPPGNVSVLAYANSAWFRLQTVFSQTGGVMSRGTSVGRYRKLNSSRRSGNFRKLPRSLGCVRSGGCRAVRAPPNFFSRKTNPLLDCLSDRDIGAHTRMTNSNLLHNQCSVMALITSLQNGL